MNEEGHDLAGMHLIRVMVRLLTISEQSLFPLLTLLLPKIIAITRPIKYAHGMTA
jgi:hypothetical protein